jgi:hypothetical protein
MKRFVLGALCGVLLTVAGLWGWAYASCRLGWGRPGAAQFSKLPSDPFLTGRLGQDSLNVTPSQVVTLHNQNGSAAIKFTKMGSDFSEYTWRFKPPSGGAEVGGSGRVFERYEEVGKEANGATRVRDAGGNHFVTAGPFSVQWSAGGDSQCWLYLDISKLGAKVLSDLSFDKVEL